MHLTLVLIHSKLKYLHTSVHKRICFHNTKHRRWKYGCCSPNSLRPISYFGSIWELCVLDLKTKVFRRKSVTVSHFRITDSGGLIFYSNYTNSTSYKSCHIQLNFETLAHCAKRARDINCNIDS